MDFFSINLLLEGFRLRIIRIVPSCLGLTNMFEINSLPSVEYPGDIIHFCKNSVISILSQTFLVLYLKILK